MLIALKFLLFLIQSTRWAFSSNRMKIYIVIFISVFGFADLKTDSKAELRKFFDNLFYLINLMSLTLITFSSIFKSVPFWRHQTWWLYKKFYRKFHPTITRKTWKLEFRHCWAIRNRLFVHKLPKYESIYWKF